MSGYSVLVGEEPNVANLGLHAIPMIAFFRLMSSGKPQMTRHRFAEKNSPLLQALRSRFVANEPTQPAYGIFPAISRSSAKLF
jgi:hypothetical protein